MQEEGEGQPVMKMLLQGWRIVCASTSLGW